MPRWKRLRENGRLSRREIEKRTGRLPNGQLSQDLKDRIIKVGCWTSPPRLGYKWRYTIEQLADIFDVSKVTIQTLIYEPRIEVRASRMVRLTAAYYSGLDIATVMKRYGVSKATLYKIINGRPGQHPSLKIHEDGEL